MNAYDFDRDYAESLCEELSDIAKEREENFVNEDSFGSECPKNWEEIADYLNEKIDAGEDQEEVWEAYHNGNYSDAPVVKWEDEE